MPCLRVATPRLRLATRERGLLVSTGTWPERLRYQPMNGDLPERLLGEDAELEGQAGEEDRRVHVAEVVGGVDGGLVDVELFACR